VDDLPSCHSHLSSLGYVFTPGGIRPGAAGHDICFLHPKPREGLGGQGVLIELVQAPPDVIEAWEKA
jgi:lactoylglutathione lyase